VPLAPFVWLAFHHLTAEVHQLLVDCDWHRIEGAVDWLEANEECLRFFWDPER
jgi:hypothetical protein